MLSFSFPNLAVSCIFNYQSNVVFLIFDTSLDVLIGKCTDAVSFFVIYFLETTNVIAVGLNQDKAEPKDEN